MQINWGTQHSTLALLSRAAASQEIPSLYWSMGFSHTHLHSFGLCHSDTPSGNKKKKRKKARVWGCVPNQLVVVVWLCWVTWVTSSTLRVWNDELCPGWRNIPQACAWLAWRRNRLNHFLRFLPGLLVWCCILSTCLGAFDLAWVCSSDAPAVTACTIDLLR